MSTFALDQRTLLESIEQSARTPRALDDFRVLGVSYRTAGLQIRSELSLDEPAAIRLLEVLRSSGVREAFVLSTCNRTEIYTVAEFPIVVLPALSRVTGVSVDILGSVAFELEADRAVRHLSRVASGLDSAALGEHEILGQIKAALALAKGQEMIGKFLAPLLQQALRTSKRVRTQTAISRNVTSIGRMAVKKAAHLAGGLHDKRVLIVGAGQIAERVAKELAHTGVYSCSICNRTEAAAIQLSELYGLQVAPFETLDLALSQSDVVFAAIAADKPLLTRERLQAPRNGPLSIVDLGVPPNVEAVEEHERTWNLVGMESINNACLEGSQSRAEAVPLAESIIDEEVRSYLEEVAQREAAPVIEALVRMGESVRKKNLDWALAQSTSDPKERKLLEDLSIRIVRGMLEAPISALKRELREPVERAVVARLFGVKDLQGGSDS